MKTKGNVMVLEELEEAAGYSPYVSGMDYTDVSGAKVHVPMKLLIRLYEIAKYDITKRNLDWDDFCNSLFEEEK